LAGGAMKEAPFVPVSWGELIDKITILRIKERRICEPDARANVARELALLERAAEPALASADVRPLLERLQAINEALWEIEDSIREADARGDFGPGFVRLARSVYERNDARAAAKRGINRLLGSQLTEEKSYKGVGALFFAPRPNDG
jgi:hypothetical protein